MPALTLWKVTDNRVQKGGEMWECSWCQNAFCKQPDSSPEGHPLPRPATNPPSSFPAFPASPSERAKYKPDASKCLLEDIPFHLVIAASEGKDLKWSSNPLE